MPKTVKERKQEGREELRDALKHKILNQEKELSVGSFVADFCTSHPLKPEQIVTVISYVVADTRNDMAVKDGSITDLSADDVIYADWSGTNAD